MRRKLIYNYWLMIVAWCMFLNDMVLLAIALGLLACAMLLCMRRKINYWRMSFLSLMLYCIASFILSFTNIPYYFSKLYLFLAVISLNSAFTFERLYLLKSKYIKPFLVTMFISMAVLSIIAIILPDSLYSLFTKNSLMIMINLIFLPYLIPCAMCLTYREGIKYLNSSFLQKKTASLH